MAANRSQLFKDVLGNYDSRIAPFNTISDTIPFTVAINLISIRHVSEKDQTLLTSSWMTLGWSDSRLRWNPSDYGGINNILTTSKHVWRSSAICIFNEINENKCFTEERPVNIFDSGWVMYATSRDSITQCPIKIKKFPFDSHSCFINIANYFSNADFLDPMEQYSKWETKYYQKNEEWEVTDAYVELVTITDVRSNTTYKQFYFSLDIVCAVFRIASGDSALNSEYFLLPLTN
jgi:nicotinic acetylcholine receptor